MGDGSSGSQNSSPLWPSKGRFEGIMARRREACKADGRGARTSAAVNIVSMSLVKFRFAADLCVEMRINVASGHSGIYS